MTNEKKHLLGWLVMPIMAVANGFVRDTTYGKAMSVDLAHSLSVIPLLVLILGCAWILAQRWPLANRSAAVRVGLAWIALTLTFEFGLGALSGLSLASMLAEYDVASGKIWPLIPLATAVAPELMRRRTLP